MFGECLKLEGAVGWQDRIGAQSIDESGHQGGVVDGEHTDVITWLVSRVAMIAADPLTGDFQSNVNRLTTVGVFGQRDVEDNWTFGDVLGVRLRQA